MVKWCVLLLTRTYGTCFLCLLFWQCFNSFSNKLYEIPSTSINQGLLTRVGFNGSFCDFFNIKLNKFMITNEHQFFNLFQRSTLFYSAWSFVFLIPTTWPTYFYPRFYPLHFCPILILEKEPVFRFLMLSAKQGNYWYHFIMSLVWHGP